MGYSGIKSPPIVNVGVQQAVFDAYKAENETQQKKNYTVNSTQLSRFWSDVAKVSERLVHVVCIGGSITQGGNSTDDINKSWTGQVRQLMQKKLGATSNGFSSVFSYLSSVPTGWTRLVEGTNLSVIQGAGGSDPIQIGMVGTEFDVIYTTKPDGGDFEVYDGVTLRGTFSSNGVLSYHNKITIDGLTYGSKAIQIKPIGTAYIEGIEYRSATKGVQVHQVGHSGIRAYDYLNDSSSIDASINAFAPSLTIIGLGINDYYQQTSIADYKTAMQQLIDNAKINGDVAMLLYLIDATAKTIPYDDYYQAAKTLAIENNCGLIDMNEKWKKSPQWAVDQGLFVDLTNVHPLDTGHKDIANTVMELISVKEDPFMTLVKYADGVLTLSPEDKIKLAKAIEVTGDIVGTGKMYSSGDMGLNNGAWQHHFRTNGDAETARNYLVKGNIYSNDRAGTYDSVNSSWLAFFDVQGTVNLLPRTTAPTVSQGRIYYDANDNTLKFYDGSSWKTVGTI